MAYRPPWSGLPDYETKDIPRGRFRRIDKLIRNSCSAYSGGNCLFLDDGDEYVCPQMRSGRIFCRYFRWVILPLDPVLEAEIYERKAEMKICVKCGKQYLPKSNRSKYCPDCSKKVRLEKQRNLMRNQRNNRKKVSI